MEVDFEEAIEKLKMNYKERDWVADELMSAMIDLSFEIKGLKGNFTKINLKSARIWDLIFILKDKRHKLEYGGK